MSRSDVAVDLVMLNGAIARTRVRLSKEHPLVIGRAKGGFQLPDERVSIRHARVFWKSGKFWVEDLDSVSGTYVDDRLLRADSMPLDNGAVLKFGETELQVRQKGGLTRLEYAALLIPLLLVAMVGALALVSSQDAAPQLVWSEQINRGEGFEAVDRLPLPKRWLRRHGLAFDRIGIRAVSDADNDGRDEIWLRAENHDYVVTFDEHGEWKELGRLPPKCVSVPDPAGQLMPVVQCPGVLYDFRDGRYRPVRQDGLVVWPLSGAVEGIPYRPEPGSPGAGGPSDGDRGPVMRMPPGRFKIGKAGDLAGFLLARGVDEPIHYMVCEGALPGVRAQVLTQSGELRPLSRGCQIDLTLNREEFGKPAVIAFTAAGHSALVADVNTFFGGNADGVFLDDRHAEVVVWMEWEPGLPQDGVYLNFEGEAGGFDAIAREGLVESGQGLLPLEGKNKASSLAVSANIMSTGSAEFDPTGCAKLQVSTADFSCSMLRFCFSSRTFLEVREVGCGESRVLLRAPYSGGVTEAVVEGLQVRAVVESRESFDHIDVLRARVAYRVRDDAAAGGG